MIKRGWTIKYLAAVLASSMVLSAVTPLDMALVQATDSGSSSEQSSGGTDGSSGEKETHRWAPESKRKYGITYKQFVEKNGVPADAHLLVGTYLIDIVPTEENYKNFEPAVSGEIGVAAKKSKLTYDQDVYFYKSELAGGEWRDLDTAKDMSAVRVGSGIKVDDAEMDEMLITKYVKGGVEEDVINPDGSDPDASRKNPFLEPSPYNLDEMSEMQTLLSMTTDGTLSYVTDEKDKAKIAENQSNYFLVERLKYMFAHDEVTGTIKLHDGDFSRAQTLNKALSARLGTVVNKKVEKQLDETEKSGGIFLDPLKTGLRAEDLKGDYSVGDDGNVPSSMRLLYHFSDTRDDLTDVMDDAVVNVWEIFLEYKDEAKKAGEEDDSFEPKEGVIYNKDKYSYLYEICSNADSTRRGQAYYNLSSNSDFHGGVGSVLSQMKKMAESGTSDLGRNIQNSYYYYPETKYSALDKATYLLSNGQLPTADTWGGFKQNTNLNTEITAATEAAYNKYVDYSALYMVRGNTAISELVYDDAEKLFKKTKKDDDVDKAIEEGILAVAIRDGNIKVADKEIKLLTDNLIKKQNTYLSRNIRMDVPDNYNDTSSVYKPGMSTEELDAAVATYHKSLLLSQQSTAKNCERAMEALIEAYLMREKTKDNYAKLLTDQLTWIRAQKGKIAKGDYATYAEEIRNEYEQYLIRKMQELGVDVPGEDKEGDAIDFDEAANKALNDGKPDLAKAIKELGDKYKNDPPKVPDGYVPELTIDSKTGEPKVKLKKDDKNKDTGNGKGEGGDTGSGTGGEGDKNISQGGGMGGESNLPVPNGSMLDNLEALLGQKFDDMDPDAQAALVAALNQYGREHKNAEAAELARDLLERIMQKSNPFVYAQYKGNASMEYVSFGALDRARRYTRYRLVTENNEITTTRTDSGLTYVYNYGSARVKKLEGKTEDMASRLVSQRDPYMNRGEKTRFPYLGEEDTQSRLGVRAEYIVDTYYAVMVTTQMEVQIKDIILKLIDLYGD